MEEIIIDNIDDIKSINVSSNIDLEKKEFDELEVLDLNQATRIEEEPIDSIEDDVEVLEEKHFQGFTPIVSDAIIDDELLETEISSVDNEVIECIDENIDNDLDNKNMETLDVNNVNKDPNIKKEEIKIDSSFLNIDEIRAFLTTNDVNNDIKAEKELNEIQNGDDIENRNTNVEESSSVNNIEEKIAKVEDVKEEVTNINNIEPDSLLGKYGENFSLKRYVCNPAIGRDNEIKQLILTLLTPEKSGILVGKPGIGKTAIVEGLGYQIQNGNVPDVLKDYHIYKLNTASLLGFMPGTNEPKIQILLNEIKEKDKLILFIDEIHTLIGAGADGDDSLDFANIFKPGLDRGNIKIIGATTTDEYDRYILTDKAFVRRFQKIDVLEPTKEHTVKIMMGSLPKLEAATGAKLKYTPFIQEKIMTFLVDLTSEYRRVYELSARYPDIALTILQQSFSYAVFDNKKEVSIRDIRKAVYNTKLVYPDVIKKELVRFNEIFSDIYRIETIQRLKGETKLESAEA